MEYRKTKNRITGIKHAKQHLNLRIAQINAQNARTVMDEIRQQAYERSIDILLIQEPYTYQNNVPGLGINTKIITDRKTIAKIKTASRIKSAIAVFNKNLDILKIEQYSNTHIVCAEVKAEKTGIYFISAYMQHSEPIEPYLQHLDKILRGLQGKQIVLCMDSNANSTLWHSRHTDPKGEALEEMISQHQLYILNRSSKAYTFDNIHGQANIDITLASSPCYRKITNWKIHNEATTSDHNLITFGISKDNQNITSTKGERYNVKKADWAAYRIAIKKKIDRHLSPVNMTTSTEAANEIESIIIQAANETIPKKTRFTKSVPWWSHTLTMLRQEARTRRKKYQKAINQTIRAKLKKEYSQHRNKYIEHIRKAKEASWRKFVTGEGNKDPWSIVYKLQTKKLKIEQVQQTIKHNGTQTETRHDTMEKILHTLIPSDTTENETEWHSETRVYAKSPPNTEDTPPFTEIEIEAAIKSLANKKAPGHDLIEPEMLKNAWPVMQHEVRELYNKCLQEGTFPERWKRAEIRILHKSTDKPADDIKSYRPISLLPILGKTLEKLIARRLSAIFHLHARTSKRQYGFKPGCSTEDAIVKLRETIQKTPEKYAIGLMFDISGAFDGVWWPNVLRNLKDRSCPRNIYRLTNSYLSERKACITSNTEQITKDVNKGCPQGSVLGPQLWNLIFDEIIEEIREKGNHAIAYADDLAIIVTGNSRMEMERKANSATTTLVEWCNKQKLSISESKSNMLLLKGYLDTKRPPTVRVYNKTIRMVDETRYLGVKFGSRLGITPHVNYISNKSRKTFSQLAAVARARWGISSGIMETLYRGVFIPIIAYASAGWADKVNAHHRRRLMQAQRYALLTVTKAYRTISSDALCVIAGAAPITLVLQEAQCRYYLRKGRNFTHHGRNYTIAANTTKNEEKRIKHEMAKQTGTAWQKMWDRAANGRHTHKFYKSIPDRINAKWIRNNYYIVQILSGHGNFKAKLKKLGLSETESCTCGETDTAEHTLFTCANHTEARRTLEKHARAHKITWPCNHEDLVRAEMFDALAVYAKEALTQKEGTTERTGEEK